MFHKGGNLKLLKHCFEKKLKFGKYHNIVDALHWPNFIRKVSGLAVLVMETADARIVSKFSPLGFIFFVLWFAHYIYSVYKAYVDDQEILQAVYSTKMIEHGVDFERIVSLLYVLLFIWKVPFKLSGDTRFMQVIVTVDKEFKNLGETVDFCRNAYFAFVVLITQMGVYSGRVLCIWLALQNLNKPFPIERMVQDEFANTLAIIVTAHFCYNLYILTERFRVVNAVLNAIKEQSSWEHKIFFRRNMAPNVLTAAALKDKYVCEKLKACASIYAMLFSASDVVNSMFGLGLLLNIFMSLMNIILYLFYLLEASSRGLFHDVPKFVDFLIFVFWQLGYAIGILFFIVFFSERTMREANKTSFIVHEIINGDFSSSVTSEAMQLSLQLLHQKPVFTAWGIYRLNYPLLEQSARAVSTYLVILLQFENSSP